MNGQPRKNIAKRAYHFLRDLLFPLPSRTSNVEYNRAIWDRYAKNWYRKRKKMQAVEEGIESAKVPDYLEYLGDEWGKKADTDQVVADYILPFVTSESVVAEIGVGGGRIAAKVAENTKEFYALDISREMLEKAKDVLAIHPQVRFLLLERPEFPADFSERFDLIYSFDVFVHLDLHTIWKYFQEIRRVLKKGGKAFLHTTNLKAPGGWERFTSQSEYMVEGHYFISPETIGILAGHAGFRIIKTSTVDPSNFYLNRDYLFVMEKV